jgi:flavodoxin
MPASPNPSRPRANAILVVCYSRSGNTLRVAKAIAQELDADLAEVSESVARRGIRGYLRCCLEVLSGRLPAIQDLTSNPAAYRLILIGTPVWISNPATPIQSFVARYRDRFDKVALFCTLGGTDSAKALERLERLVGKTPCTTLAISEREIGSEACNEKILRFAKELSAQAVRTP